MFSLAESGESDPEYTELLKFINGEVNGISKDSPYLDCKSLIPFNSVTDLGEGKRIITKDSLEVLVPFAGRKRLLDILHSTHFSWDSMFRMSMGKFTWPDLKSDQG